MLAALATRAVQKLIGAAEVVAAWRELALRGSDAANTSLDDPEMVKLFWDWLLMISEAMERHESKGFIPAPDAIDDDTVLSVASTGSYLTSRDAPMLYIARHFELLDRTVHRTAVRGSGSWLVSAGVPT